MDLALTESDDGSGEVILHRPDCATVARHRREERPVMTMFGITRPLPPDAKRCACLLSTASHRPASQRAPFHATPHDDH